MAEVGERGSDVRLIRGVSRSRVPFGDGTAGEWCGHAVEIESSVQVVVAGEPFRAEGNFIFAPLPRSGLAKRGFEVIVHVLGRASRDQMKNMVGRIVGIGNDAAEPMGAEEPPCRLHFQTCRFATRYWRALRRLVHHEVIDRAFAGVEQPQHKFLPERRSGCRRRHRPISVIAPACRSGPAARPSLQRRVVGPRVAQFEA